MGWKLQFWKDQDKLQRLKQYLIVCGVVSHDRADASGFLGRQVSAEDWVLHLEEVSPTQFSTKPCSNSDPIVGEVGLEWIKV